jgi:hypothetical protein
MSDAEYAMTTALHSRLSLAYVRDGKSAMPAL